MEVAPKSTRRVSNVDEHRNKRMNKSAILVNKWEVELAQEIPRYVAGSHRSKKKTININKGLMHQGVRARAIHKILQVSIKKAFEIQQKSRKSQHLIRLKKSKQISKPYPRKVLNMLFRQNIKNYNPYVSVLSQLEGMSLVTNQKDRISKICYLGIARNYFQVRKYYQTPQYSRVGILIRTYMVDVMRDVLQKKMQNEPMTVFIKINPTALSFNPYERPKQLQQQISKKRYYEIIQGINRVIVDEYQKYKKGNFQFIHGSLTYSETLLYLFLGIIVICMLVWSNDSNQHILSYCAFFLILFVVAAGMAGSWAESNRNLDQVCAPQNINNRIQDRLRDYLKSVTNEALTWRLGPDFYWIQIQNVKVRKRKNQASPDNF